MKAISLKLISILFLILLSAGTNSCSFAQNAPSTYASGTTYQQALTIKKPIVLEFYADWCGACRQVGPILNSVRSEYSDKFTFVNLNIDKPENSTLSKQYNVTSLPSIFIVNPLTGEAKFLNQSDYFDAATLKKDLDNYLKQCQR